ncbi:MAG: DUF2505 domain-containing protein [Proteobacteria bacterium]|nr:DUF2505 domain-containing protein [Pseudomonadota bacterium]
MDLHLEHTFAAAPQRFWSVVLLDPEYQDALYRQLRLHIEHCVIEHEGSGDELRVRRELHLTPDRELPAALRKLVRGTALVKERALFDARAGKMTIEIELPVIGAWVDFHGVYTWREQGPAQLQRNWEAHCHARLPLIGRQIETYLLAEMASSFEQAYRFTCDWLARPPSAASAVPA